MMVAMVRARRRSLLRVSPLGGGAAALALFGVACLDHQLDPADVDGGAAGGFIALQRDFQDFRSWRRVLVAEAAAAAIEGTHPAGPRYAYVNGAAAAGAFPVATIIVKTVEVG